MRFTIPKRLNENDYKSLISKLNEKQYKYLHHILSNVKNNVTYNEYVGGAGGVRKSMLITVLVQTLLKYLDTLPGNNPDELKILITAVTGKVIIYFLM